MRVRLFIYVIFVVLVTALASVPAQAFGISYQYLPNKTLDLYPGQNYMFKLTVQNKDEDAVNVKVEINTSIATLAGGPELKVPGKTYDSHVFFNITIPEDAQVGDKYVIPYMVSQADRGTGQIPLAVRYNRELKIGIVEKPPEPEKTVPPVEKEKFKLPKWVVIPIVIILIIIILLIIWKKSRQMSDKIIRPKKEKKDEIYPSKQSHLKPFIVPEKTLKPNQYFHLKNGKNLKSLKDLALALPVMSFDVFGHHVNSQKNDFAKWISHSLGKHDFANKLFKENSRIEMIELIKNELEKK